MPIQQMLLGTSPGGDTYWILSDGKDTSGYKMQYDGVYVDTAGNVYAYGKTNEPWNSSNMWSRDHMCLNKYDKHGTNIFYKRYSNNVTTNGHEQTYDGLQVFSDGNLMLANKSGMGQASAVKCNTSGSVLWKKRYGTDNTYGIQGGVQSIAIDSSNNCMFVGGGLTIYNGSGSGNISLWQLSSSGSLVNDWNVAVSATGTYGVSFVRMQYDSSGNLYIVGSRGMGSGTGSQDKDGYIMKLNSSMVIQWQHTLGSSGYYPIETYDDLAFDSSDNVYCVGTHRDGNSRHYAFIAKYNSSGTLQWQKKYGNGTQNLYFSSIDIDSDDNVYCSGYVDVYGSSPHWVKLNTSGVLQYKRAMRELYSNNSSADWMRSMKVFGDAIYLVGRRYTGSVRHYGWIAKLPKAGPNTGTYGSKYEISEPNYTMSNTSFTEDRATVNFSISEVTNKSVFNGTMSVNTATWPEDIYSIYDVDFGQ